MWTSDQNTLTSIVPEYGTDRLVNAAGGPGPPAFPHQGARGSDYFFFAFFFAFFLAAFFFAGIRCPPPFGYRMDLAALSGYKPRNIVQQ